MLCKELLHHNATAKTPGLHTATIEGLQSPPCQIEPRLRAPSGMKKSPRNVGKALVTAVGQGRGVPAMALTMMMDAFLRRNKRSLERLSDRGLPSNRMLTRTHCNNSMAPALRFKGRLAISVQTSHRALEMGLLCRIDRVTLPIQGRAMLVQPKSVPSPRRRVRSATTPQPQMIPLDATYIHNRTASREGWKGHAVKTGTQNPRDV